MVCSEIVSKGRISADKQFVGEDKYQKIIVKDIPNLQYQNATEGKLYSYYVCTNILNYLKYIPFFIKNSRIKFKSRKY